MSRKEKWGISLYLLYLLTMSFVSIFYSLWSNLVWLWLSTIMLCFIWRLCMDNIYLADVVKSQDRDLDFLMSLDPFKHAKQAKTEARVASENCYHYLQRIGKLKAENKQLKIINKNLIETKFKGKANGKRKS